MLGHDDPSSWNIRMAATEIAKAIKTLATAIFFGCVAIAFALVR